MICPDCEYKNHSEAKICTRCGVLLIPASETNIIEDIEHDGASSPKYGTIRLGNRLSLQVLDSDIAFNFDKDDIEEVIIGRQDPDTGDAPPIDLGVVNGLERGVSRNHAIIIRRDNALHIKDNESANGTYLNGQRLRPNQLKVLRDGDDIRVGKLDLRVTFG